MQITATARNVRLSPEKVRLVVDQIKKMSPDMALKTLNFVSKKPSFALKKVIKSAIANAKNNFGVDESSLVFKEIMIGKGAVYKRFQPISRGQAHKILKRTSYIKIVLEGVKKTQTKTEKLQNEQTTAKKLNAIERRNDGTKS